MFARWKKAKAEKASPNAAPALALIVEDEPILLMNAKEMLEDMGFSVLSAGTVDEAMTVMDSNEIELMITDIHMPGSGDGLALAQTTSQRWPDVRIVVCSGRQRVVQSQLPPGATFVPKPYTVDDIENAILSF